MTEAAKNVRDVQDDSSDLLARSQQKMTDLFNALDGAYLERSALALLLCIGLIARVNLFIIGAPGTAKSHAIKAFARAIGFKFFGTTINGDTTPATLFGMPNTKTLEETGRIERVTDNTILDAEFVFLDEFWKGNKTLILSTLEVTNEGTFTEGPFVIDPCPIKMAVIASNEYPKDSDLDAAYDRFPLRLKVGDIEDDDNFQKLAFRRGVDKITCSVEREEIEALQAAVDAVQWGEREATKLRKIRRTVMDEGFKASARRWMDGIKLVCASAVFRGSNQVGDSDWMILVDALWDRAKDRAKLFGLIGNAVNPNAARCRNLLDGATESLRKLPDLSALTSAAITKAVAADMVLTVQTELDEFEKTLTDIASEVGDNDPEVKTAWQNFQTMRDHADDVAQSVNKHGRTRRA